MPGPAPATRFGALRQLDPTQFASAMATCTGMRKVAARTQISRRDEPMTYSHLVMDGMVGRYVSDREGSRRRLVALQVAGDFMDLHSYPLHRLDHDVISVSATRLAVFPHAGIDDLIAREACMARALWGMTMVDASIHRHWAFRIGAMRAMERLANFLCELQARLGRAGQATAGRFALPLTQADVGEAVGLSAVHVNRALRDLREEGACTFREGWVDVTDPVKLRRLGSFDPYFLYSPDSSNVG